MTETVAGRLRGPDGDCNGASRGIGLALAQRLVSEGARVCITARSPKPLEEAAETMDPDAVTTMVGRADDPNHRHDVLDRVTGGRWH